MDWTDFYSNQKLIVILIEIEPRLKNIIVGNAHSIVISEVSLSEKPAKHEMFASDNISLLVQVEQQKQRISQIETKAAPLKDQLEDKIAEARQ